MASFRFRTGLNNYIRWNNVIVIIHPCVDLRLSILTKKEIFPSALNNRFACNQCQHQKTIEKNTSNRNRIAFPGGKLGVYFELKVLHRFQFRSDWCAISCFITIQLREATVVICISISIYPYNQTIWCNRLLSSVSWLSLSLFSFHDGLRKCHNFDIKNLKYGMKANPITLHAVSY